MLKSNSYNAYRACLSLDERNSLIEKHLPQIKFIAERIAVRLPYCIDVNDLINIGVLGLLDAVDKFDPYRGVQFKTYAELRVRGAILDSLRDLDWAPRSLRRKAKEVEKKYAQLEQQYGQAASEEQVAMALNMPLAEFQSLLSELRWVSITDLDGDKENLGGQIPDQKSKIPLAIYEQKEVRQKLSQAIDKLPERERQVIALYYVEELTMKEIGLVLDITESRVSQLHTQALLRLRSSLNLYSEADNLC